MKRDSWGRQWIGSAAVLAMLASVAAFTGRAEARDAQRERAAPLVEAALEAELAGDAEARAAQLAQAIQLAPDAPDAHWQNGEVLYQGAWRSIADVQALAAADVKRKEFDQWRTQAADDPESLLQLARWCDRAGLKGQAQVCWTKILSADPDNAEARRGLGLVEYQGELVPADKLDELKEKVRQAKQDFERFTPLFERWMRDAASGDAAAREAALNGFREMTDAAAIPALEHAILHRALERKGPLGRLPAAEADALRTQLCRAYLTALASMPEHEATLALLQCGMHAESDELRRLAAKGLRPRPATDYVPQLMGALTAPIEVEMQMNAFADGMSLAEKLQQEQPGAITEQTRQTHMMTVRRNPKARRLINFNPIHSQRLTTQALSTANDVAAANAAAAANNERIFAVLDVTTDGLKLGSDPRVWWQAWQQYNELYAKDKARIKVQQFNEYTTETMSCFVAGTVVWTDLGARPIEQIVPGDLVLSQDPQTGELAFRPVMETTIRPPSPLVRIAAGEEEIITTRGHRFWVDGQGWEMAKFLTKMRLHAVDRGVEIADVGPWEGDALEAYNLVVEGFHTYFVGQSRLLVGDNSCPRPTLAAIPGMRRMRSLTPATAGSSFAGRRAPETRSSLSE